MLVRRSDYGEANGWLVTTNIRAALGSMVWVERNHGARAVHRGVGGALGRAGPLAARRAPVGRRPMGSV